MWRPDRFVAEAPGLDIVSNDPWPGGGQISSREVREHMIEEYGRLALKLWSVLA